MTFPVYSAGSDTCYIPTGKKLTKSLRFRASASAYLNRTPGTAGNRLTWTYSAWIKKSLNTSGNSQYLMAASPSGSQLTYLYFDVGDVLRLWSYDAGTTANLVTTQVFQDPSAWYHIVVAFDSSQATASDRIKFYVNGTQITSFSTATYPAQNYSSWFNASGVVNYQGISSSILAPLDGYLAEMNYIDGQALAPTAFGAFDSVTGVWQPINYTGAYGTNGFYLPFTDTSSVAALGTDFSGNSNTWTVNNVSLTTGSTYDSMTDVPTLTSPTISNYAVLNPLFGSTTYVPSIINGNLTASLTSAGASDTRGTMSFSGKMYFEVNVEILSTGTLPYVGIVDASSAPVSYVNNGYIFCGTGGGANGFITKTDGSNAGTSYGAVAAGDTIGVAIDTTTNKLWYAINNVWVASGNPATGANPTDNTLTSGTSYVPFVSLGQVAGSKINANFGQQPFAYTPPAGFLPLNTFNLDCPTIPNGREYFTPTLYTGNGTTQTVTNTGFYPDLVWIKSRSNAYSNYVADSVRGATNYLVTDNTNAQVTDANTLTAFNSNGFNVGLSLPFNGSGSTFVGWQWNAGSGTSAANTDGSIASTVSVNPSAGFSVVTYTGNGVVSTVGHGLGIAPQLIFVKNRTTANDWAVGCQFMNNNVNPWNYWMQLDTNSAQLSNSGIWNLTQPSSSVITLGNAGVTNGSGEQMVAYCWAPIPGFSAFGSYTGNGSANGPFVYTGFRPAYFLLKNITNSGYEWYVFDTARNTYNSVNDKLYPNLPNAEDTAFAAFNFTANGVSIQDSRTDWNGVGNTYIYAAFAENPFKYANAR